MYFGMFVVVIIIARDFLYTISSVPATVSIRTLQSLAIQSGQTCYKFLPHSSPSPHPVQKVTQNYEARYSSGLVSATRVS